jgi:hypothetical protein
MKSYRSLSPQGLATPNPRADALCRNAASDRSPARFVFPNRFSLLDFGII